MRLTRSQSGNILDIDFEFGAQGMEGAAGVAAPAPAPAATSAMMPLQHSTAVVASGRKLKILVSADVPPRLPAYQPRARHLPAPVGHVTHSVVTIDSTRHLG